MVMIYKANANLLFAVKKNMYNIIIVISGYKAKGKIQIACVVINCKQHYQIWACGNEY